MEPTVEIPTRLLALGMTHEDGTLLASELYPVAEACGQTPEQLRSCLRRLVHEGLFTREGSGREARFSATDAGRAGSDVTASRTRLAYAQDAAGRGWDGHWHVAAFAIPERQRRERNSLRDWLLQLGGAAMQSAVYVSPRPWNEHVRETARRLGVDGHLTLAETHSLEIAGERDPRLLARRLWPIDELAGRYEQFSERFAWVPDELERVRGRSERIPDAAFLPGALSIAVAFQDCFDQDPLLPPELLPRPWPGRAARELLARSRRLALALRQERGGPALFRNFDEALEAIP